MAFFILFLILLIFPLTKLIFINIMKLSIRKINLLAQYF